MVPTALPPPRVIEAVPNFSTADPALIDRLWKAAEPALALHSTGDRAHGRSVLTIASGSLDALASGLFAMVAAAAEMIDIRSHHGVHPRVGAADVVPLVPLAGVEVAECADAAETLAERIWKELRIPCHFYGLASRGAESVRLADIRRGRLAPDVGHGRHPTAGAVCIGIRPPLVAFNLILSGLERAAAVEIAGRLRGSTDGGLPGVQALIFDVGDPAGPQLSLNLTRLEAAGPAEVLERLRREGVGWERSELVGLCPAAQALPDFRGGVLEAVLAGRIHLQAAAAIELNSGEIANLAPGLRRVAARLLQAGASPEELLASGEQSAAAFRVLLATGVGAPWWLDGLRYAAAGLSAAADSRWRAEGPPPARIEARLRLLGG